MSDTREYKGYNYTFWLEGLRYTIEKDGLILYTSSRCMRGTRWTCEDVQNNIDELIAKGGMK